MKKLMVIMVLLASVNQGWAEDSRPIGKAAQLLRGWLEQRGSPAQFEATNEHVLAHTPTQNVEIDVTFYRIDRRPNRPTLWEVRPMPLPQGFRIEVEYAENRGYLPQILTQYMTAHGPECQRFVHLDRQGQTVSTVLWFAPGLHTEKSMKGQLYYSVEFGNGLKDDFAYAVNDLLKHL